MKIHNCVQKAKSGSNVVIVQQENGVIDILRSAELTFNDVMVGNIVFCPFCGINLKTAKK